MSNDHPTGLRERVRAAQQALQAAQDALATAEAQAAFNAKTQAEQVRLTAEAKNRDGQYQP